MRINKQYTLHQVADEHIIMLKSKKGNEMTRVASLNKTSVWLWNELIDKDFSEEDVINLLLSQFNIDEATARRDAQQWINTLNENDLLG